MEHHPVVFWELASHDAEQSVRFLQDVFEWDITYDKESGIHDIPAFAEPVPGGVFTLRRPRLPFLTMYIKVADIDAMAERIVEHGGLIIDPPQEIPGGSKICLFAEPSGVTLAMIEPAQPA